MAERAAAGSRLVIYAALAGNLAVAAVKLAAGLFTGSSAMLSEAAHSLVDTGNQGLLLIGLRQAAQRPTASHPFGHGLRLYFWSFVVAILIFGLGAGVSIYGGVLKIVSPRPVTDIWVNYWVLGAAFLIEGTTLVIGLREFRRSKDRRGWFEALRHSKDPTVFTVLMEDSAALLGICVAASGLLLSQLLHAPVFDGIASVLVGILLACTAWFLASECHGLLAGEAAAPEICDNVRRLAQQPGVRRVNDVMSMHFGPSDVLLALSLDFEDEMSAGAVQDAVTRIEQGIQRAHPEMTRIFVEAQRTQAHRSGLRSAAV
ncbi:cation diffusion facilitator family transporter [Lichenicoccus roseus]|uniref:Cation transporter n=1 Tax=Lichenicoccus roseus TaxID=2683649 RepID=A0A5R9J6I2_9PROT|nr:cation diffusion facilitator family transporter [Lichenicoccus roseus]TLU73215.1 cation transporter [Lichenicoccus roseus]